MARGYFSKSDAERVARATRKVERTNPQPPPGVPPRYFQHMPIWFGIVQATMADGSTAPYDGFYGIKKIDPSTGAAYDPANPNYLFVDAGCWFADSTSQIIPGTYAIVLKAIWYDGDPLLGNYFIAHRRSPDLLKITANSGSLGAAYSAKIVGFDSSATTYGSTLTLYNHCDTSRSARISTGTVVYAARQYGPEWYTNWPD